ncbi:hypothetical protein [Jeotgalibacillus marinus]|uniref:Uncharacterized protein n=1 Tax=Jeotgalibacillus marinus TaxID=86667 RepID=A0ABV3Q085_9BACL
MTLPSNLKFLYDYFLNLAVDYRQADKTKTENFSNRLVLAIVPAEPLELPYVILFLLPY